MTANTSQLTREPATVSDPQTREKSREVILIKLYLLLVLPPVVFFVARWIAT